MFIFHFPFIGLTLEIYEIHDDDLTEKKNSGIVTNTTIIASSSTTYSMFISVISSDPNPFEREDGTDWTEDAEWTYISSNATGDNKEVSAIIKSNTSNSRLRFPHLYSKGILDGTYSFTLGNYTVWFKLEVTGKR